MSVLLCTSIRKTRMEIREELIISDKVTRQVEALRYLQGVARIGKSSSKPVTTGGIPDTEIPKKNGTDLKPIPKTFPIG